MAATVFIDGEVGTTGLQIHARLAGRKDVTLLHLAENERKNAARRREMLNDADLAILCLPDDAAREAVAMIDSAGARVIDASTAHRIADGWVYGMAELDSGQPERIASAARVSNPGCYPVASVAMLRPLVESGLLSRDAAVTINAISGYTGGGKGLIEKYEDPDCPDYTKAPFSVYGLGFAHKHAPEIHRYSGLNHRPLFVPSVGRFRQGMIVQIPLQLWSLPGRPGFEELHRVLADYYADCRFVTVAPLAQSAVMTGLEPEGVNGTNELRLHVFGNAEHGQAVLMGLLDNLGKGASGMAVQNMNLMLGLAEDTGL
jgi:N-acetyl-gamma-glutamyl-phosphate reductase